MTKLIAIPTRDGMVDDHFGHCAYYSIVTLDEQNQVVKQERLDSPEGCGCKSNIASVMQEMGITLMLAGNMGTGAYNKLSAHGITVVRGCHGAIEDVLQAYLNGELEEENENGNQAGRKTANNTQLAIYLFLSKLIYAKLQAQNYKKNPEALCICLGI